VYLASVAVLFLGRVVCWRIRVLFGGSRCKHRLNAAWLADRSAFRGRRAASDFGLAASGKGTLKGTFRESYKKHLTADYLPPVTLYTSSSPQLANNGISRLNKYPSLPPLAF